MKPNGGRLCALFICAIFMLSAFASFPVGVADTSRGEVALGSRATVSKVVLGELFTKSTCGACQSADGAMDRLSDNKEYFPDRVALIEWHVGDAYTTTAHNQRMSYYGGIPTIPRAVFDGLLWNAGGDIWGANSTYNDVEYKKLIDARPKETQVKIDISRSLNPAGDSGTYNITVTALDTVLNTSLHLRVLLVEDDNDTVGNAKFRYTAKTMLSDIPITLQNAGDKVYQNKTFTHTSDRWKIALVVFVQTDVTREVLQAQTSLFPGNNPPLPKGAALNFSMEEDTVDEHIDLDDHYYDSEGEGMSFTIRSLAKESHIEIYKNSENKLRFTPLKDWSGSEEFLITADDTYSKNGKSYNRFTVTVTPTNDAPHVASPLSNFSMMEGAVKTHINLDKVFDDIDGDTLTYSVTGDKHLNVSISPSSSVVTIAAPNGVHGIAEVLTFHASDGKLEVADDIKVTVKHVNHAPEVLAPFENVTMDEDTVDKSIDLDEVFYDFDEVDTLEFEQTGNYYINVNIDPITHVVSLRPNENWNGEEDIKFTATDLIAAPISEMLTVTVKPVNDAPTVIGDLGDVVMNEDTIFKTEVPLGYIFNDVDGDPLTYGVVRPVNMEVGIDDENLVSIAPHGNWHGTEEVTITASDGCETARYILEVVVRSVNDKIEVVSTAPDDMVTIDEGENVTFSIEARDADGDEQSYTWYMNGRMMVSGTDPKLGFSADFMSAGTYDVVVIVSDEFTEVEHQWKLKVQNANRAPTVKIVSPDPTGSYKEGQTVELKAVVSDEDVGDVQTIRWFVDDRAIDDSNTDSLAYSLTGGTHTIKVTVFDGSSAGNSGTASDQVTIKVDKKKKAVPGFEVLLLMMALVVAVASVRRRR